MSPWGESNTENRGKKKSQKKPGFSYLAVDNLTQPPNGKIRHLSRFIHLFYKALLPPTDPRPDELLNAE